MFPEIVAEDDDMQYLEVSVTSFLEICRARADDRTMHTPGPFAADDREIRILSGAEEPDGINKMT